jgi:hypothetical protein
LAYVFSFDERSGIAFSKNAGGAAVPRAGVVGVPFRGAPRLDRGERSESGTRGGPAEKATKLQVGGKTAKETSPRTLRKAVHPP